MKVKVKLLSRVQLFATPWTVAYQDPLSMGFSRQECWNGLAFPSPEDLPDPGIEPGSPALQADALLSEPPGKSGYFLPRHDEDLREPLVWRQGSQVSMRVPGGSEVKASAWNVGDLGLIPVSGRSPGEGNGNPLQHSCLENPMDRGS